MGLTPEELAQKIKDAQARQGQGADSSGKKTGMNAAAAMAMRMATDLVAAVIVGAVLGYWLDIWLDTSPLFMILFLFFGFASGFFSIYRLQTGRPFAPWLKDKKAQDVPGRTPQAAEDGKSENEM